MVNEDVLKKVRENVLNINNLCHDYQVKKSERERILKRIRDIKNELDSIREEEELKVELAKTAYLPEKIEETKIDLLQKNKGQEEQNLSKIAEEIMGIRRQILSEGRNLRFPVDASFHQEGDLFIFKWLEDRFSEEALVTLSEILEMLQPLKIEEVSFTPDEITVKAKSGKQAIQSLIEAIRTFRLKIETMLNIYDKIDEFVDRVRSSQRYFPILKVLYEAGQPLSIDDITKMTSLEKNIVYNSCYNLLREIWNPPPIRKAKDRHFELSVFGSIIMKRCKDKYPNLWSKLILSTEGET